MLAATPRLTRCLLSRPSALSFAARAAPLNRFSTVRVMADSAANIKALVAKDSVVVYSKTYCPYCTKVKGLFTQLNVPFTAIELDQGGGGDEVQGALQGITNARTVPQVFIGGKFIGGCDDTHALHRSGALKEALAAVSIAI